jgi:hypothetical protein
MHRLAFRTRSIRLAAALVPAAVGVLGGSCTQAAPPTVVAVIGTDIPYGTLTRIRVRAARSWNPFDAGSIDLTYDLGNSSAQVMLPQSIGLEPTMADGAIAVVDNSDSNIPDDPNSPPSIRRVVRVAYTPTSGRVLVFLHHNCLATVRPSGAAQCPGAMPNCTLSQWCEAQGMTCGNDGCCRSIDVTAAEIQPITTDVQAVPQDATAGESCGMSADGGSDASPDAADVLHDATDAPTDAPRG